MTNIYHVQFLVVNNNKKTITSIKNGDTISNCLRICEKHVFFLLSHTNTFWKKLNISNLNFLYFESENRLEFLHFLDF